MYSHDGEIQRAAGSGLRHRRADCRYADGLRAGEADGRDYIALLSCDEDGEPDPEGEIYFYRYSEDADGNPEIENIEDDEEYEIATDVFDEWLDEQEIGDDD